MESGPETLPPVGPGTVLRDKWRLDSHLAHGATSEVYAATHRNSRRFAIKVMSPRLSRDPTQREPWIKQAYVANGIPHEGVIHTLDDDVLPDGTVFTVMDLVDGETLLSRWQREGRKLRPSHVVELILGVLEILAAAHEHQIIHGALSLEHVLITRNGRIKLCGFATSTGPKLALEGTTLALDVANAPFVTPEQAIDSAVVTPRTDLYAVAAMSFALLTGSFVLEGAAFRTALPNLAPELSQVFDRALSFDPARRWPSAMSMREAITEATSQAVRVKTGPNDAVPRSRQTREPLDPADVPGARMVPVAVEKEPTPLSSPGSSALASIRRRGTTILAITGIDRAKTTELETRAEQEGFRVELVLSRAALVIPHARASGRDEAHEVAAIALALRDAWIDVPLTLITGVDLLTDHTETNVALKRALTAVAAPGMAAPIRLDGATARLLSRLFDVDHDREGALLIGERPPEGAFRQLLGRPTSFVGRDRELRELVEHFLKSASHETASATLVVAEPGLGKSRLVEEAARRILESHPDVEVWSVSADPMRRDVAFGLAAGIIDRAASVSNDDPPEDRRKAIADRVSVELEPRPGVAISQATTRVTEFLAELAGVGFADRAGPQVELARRDAASMGDQMRFAFLDFMSAVLSRRPVCIVVEDLQWADAASLELLGHALTLLKQKPWCVIATARPEIDQAHPAIWNASRITLDGLEGAALMSIAQVAVESVSTIQPSDVALLVERSGGNPLYLEELLRSRAEGAHATEAGLVSVVAARVDALNPELHRVLATASVYGGAFSLAGVTALLGASPEPRAIERTPAQLAMSLEELCQKELIVLRRHKRGGSEYAFRHALVREVAYARLHHGELTDAHRTAGVFLERQGEHEAAVLAEHFSRAKAETEAAAWYERSAAEALERNDIGRALELATKGLAYEPRHEVALPLLALKAECHAWRGEYLDARNAAMLVLDGASRGSALWCRALTPLATGLTRGGDPKGATALAEELLAAFPEASDKRALAGASTSLVAYLLRLGRPDLVRGLMTRLADLGREPDASSATRAYVESARSWCAMFAGDFSECLRHDREAVRCFHEASDLRNACRETTSIGYDLMVLGVYEDAESAFRAALATAERLGIGRVVSNAKHHLTMITLRLGRLDEAHQLAIEALELGTSSADPFAIGSMGVYLGLVLAALGNEAGAASAFEHAIVQFANTPSGRAWPLAELARVRLAQGRVDEALVSAEAAMAVLAATGPAEEGDASIRVTHAEVLAASGRVPEARAAIERALRRLEERAQRINDTTLKQSFLHRVPEHAATLLHARAMGVLV